jgi:hypothetical protein
LYWETNKYFWISRFLGSPPSLGATLHRARILEQTSSRKFAMEVITIAGINSADFDSHPDRLKRYLGTDITM